MVLSTLVGLFAAGIGDARTLVESFVVELPGASSSVVVIRFVRKLTLWSDFAAGTRDVRSLVKSFVIELPGALSSVVVMGFVRKLLVWTALAAGKVDGPVRVNLSENRVQSKGGKQNFSAASFGFRDRSAGSAWHWLVSTSR